MPLGDGLIRQSKLPACLAEVQPAKWRPFWPGYNVLIHDNVTTWKHFPHSLRWRHNDGDSVSNHQPHDCLLSCLFGRTSKKTSKLRVTGLCVGNSPGTGEFPAQMASNAENVSIWWRNHVTHPLWVQFTGGFISQRDSKAQFRCCFGCQLEQAVAQRVNLLVVIVMPDMCFLFLPPELLVLLAEPTGCHTPESFCFTVGGNVFNFHIFTLFKLGRFLKTGSARIIHSEWPVLFSTALKMIIKVLQSQPLGCASLFPAQSKRAVSYRSHPKVCDVNIYIGNIIYSTMWIRTVFSYHARYLTSIS